MSNAMEQGQVYTTVEAPQTYSYGAPMATSFVTQPNVMVPGAYPGFQPGIITAPQLNVYPGFQGAFAFMPEDLSPAPAKRDVKVAKKTSKKKKSCLCC